MKMRFSLWLLAIICSANTLYASKEYKEDMDSLLHKVEGHRQGIVVLDKEGIKLNIYASSQFEAPNGIYYYRWWDLGQSFLTPGYDSNNAAFWTQQFILLDYGYRFDEGKMYVYNFKTEKETVAYDFTLQPGEQFTTLDGISWEVVSRKMGVLESTFDYSTDYKNEHVVLGVQSVDGTLTDEWVEYIGSLHYPIQHLGRTDIFCSHTAFFNFLPDALKLVYFNFSEAPIYGQYVVMNPDPNANTNPTKDYSFTADEASLNVTINHYTWFTRHYCYTFCNDNTFDIHSIELGPMLDGGGDGISSFDLTFPSVPSDDGYTVIYNGETLTTSINSVQLDTADNSQIVNLQIVKYHDLTGRRLAAPPAKGMYIENGRLKINK